MADNVQFMQDMLSTLKSIDKNITKQSSSGFAGINSALMGSAASSASGLSAETKSAADNVNRFIASLDEAAVRFKEKGKIAGLLSTTFDQIDKATGRIMSKIGDKTGISKMLKGVKNIGSGIKEWGTALKEAKGFMQKIYVLTDGITSALGSAIGFVGKIAGGFLNLGKVLVNSVTSVMGNALTTMTKISEFLVTLPIEIAKKASELGGQLRRELVEVIGQAVENTKELFDSASNSGNAFKQLGGIARGALLSFQDVGSTMVKLFGYGAEGAARMISEVTKNIADMGVFSEVFADSTTKSGKSIEFLIRLTKGLGMQSADLNYVVAEAMKNGEHYQETLTRMKENMDSVSTEFGVNRKRLSMNFFELRKDITQFGHLTDIQLQRTAASAMQLGIEMKDVSAIFNKFSTFEDAANSAALLQQTFGMNIDALQLIRAEDPMEIIEMFRQSMLMTGRSFDDLNRHEKALMAQHTGMSAEALKQVMNYRTLGKSYEDIKKIMNDQKPEERQIRAMRDMSSSMSEIQKIMDKKDFFNAFLDGFSKSIMYGTKFGKAMASVNKAMETFYTEGLRVDKKLVNKITAPFAGILNEITEVFSVKGLRSLVNEILLNLSAFIEDITNPDKCLSGWRANSVKWKTKIEGLFNFEALLADQGFLGKLVRVSGKIIGMLLRGMTMLGPGLIRGFGNAIKSVIKFFKTRKIDDAFNGKSLGRFLGLDDDCWEDLKKDIEFAFNDIMAYLFGGTTKKQNRFGVLVEVEEKGLFKDLKEQIFDGKGSMFDGLGKRLGEIINGAFGTKNFEELFEKLGNHLVKGMSQAGEALKVVSAKIVEGIVTMKDKLAEIVEPILEKMKQWFVKNTDFGSLLFGGSVGDSGKLKIEEDDSAAVKAVKRAQKGGATHVVIGGTKDAARGATKLAGEHVHPVVESALNVPLDLADSGYLGETRAAIKGVKRSITSGNVTKKVAKDGLKKVLKDGGKKALKEGGKKMLKAGGKTLMTGGLNVAGTVAKRSLGPLVSIISEYAESEMNLSEALADLDKKHNEGVINKNEYEAIKSYIQDEENKAMFARTGGGLLGAALGGAATGAVAGSVFPGIGNVALGTLGFIGGGLGYMLGSEGAEYAFDTQSAQEALQKKLEELQKNKETALATDPNADAPIAATSVRKGVTEEQTAALKSAVEPLVLANRESNKDYASAVLEGFQGMHVMLDNEQVGVVIAPRVMEATARLGANSALNTSHRTPGPSGNRAALTTPQAPTGAG